VYENNGNLTLKIADFGLAMKVTSPIFTICGTPTYVAPEILSEEGYGLEVDVWAAGVILYIMLCGFPPFRSVNRKQTELFDLIEKCEYEFLEPYWDDVSENAKDLISKILVTGKDKRLSSKQVFDHPWLTQFGLDRNNTLYSIVSPKRNNRFKTTARTVQSIERMKMILKLEREKFITHVHHEEDDTKNHEGDVKQLTVFSEKSVISRENTSDSEKSNEQGGEKTNCVQTNLDHEGADQSKDSHESEGGEKQEVAIEKNAPKELAGTDDADTDSVKDSDSDSNNLLDTNELQANSDHEEKERIQSKDSHESEDGEKQEVAIENTPKELVGTDDADADSVKDSDSDSNSLLDTNNSLKSSEQAKTAESGDVIEPIVSRENTDPAIENVNNNIEEVLKKNDESLHDSDVNDIDEHSSDTDDKDEINTSDKEKFINDNDNDENPSDIDKSVIDQDESASDNDENSPNAEVEEKDKHVSREKSTESLKSLTSPRENSEDNNNNNNVNKDKENISSQESTPGEEAIPQTEITVTGDV